MTLHATKPLSGVRVFLSRDEDSQMARVLTLAGAQVIARQLCVHTHRPAGDLEQSMKRLENGEYSWVCFTSPRTLPMIDAAGFDTSAILGNAVSKGTKIAVVGPTTAVSVFNRGQRASLTAGNPPSSAALVQSFQQFIMVEERPVLIPCASIAKKTLPEGLRAQGWNVEILPVYDTETAPALPRAMHEALTSPPDGEAPVDLFLVTSGSVARAADALIDGDKPPAVALGEPSASMLRQLDWETYGVCPSADMPDIIDTLARAAQDVRKARHAGDTHNGDTTSHNTATR